MRSLSDTQPFCVQTADGLPPGAIIGDYEVLSPIGSGGMGRVYRVRHLLSKRIEAMKLVLPGVDEGTEMAGRFEREIEMQARLNHPNICALHTAVRIGDRLALVMELAEGVPLTAVLKGGPLEATKAVAYTIQLLEALAHAHDHGVIHRDVKPGNIIITADGTAKLVDFGVAKSTECSELTAAGMTVGSPYYMSPEVIMGQTPDARCDIYSAGVTLYEMVTGRRPVDAPTTYGVLEGHLHTKPVAPHALNAHVPKALGDVILKAMGKDPSERFQTAREFEAALQQAMTPTATRQRRWRVPAAAVLLVAAAITTANRWIARASSVSPAPQVTIQQALAPEPVIVHARTPKPTKPKRQPTEVAAAVEPPAPVVKQAPLVEEVGMESWGDVSWTQDSGWYVCRGPNPSLYPLPTAGSFVFTIHKRKGNARWVLRWRNSADYLLFELDNHAFHRKQVRGGVSTDLAVTRRQDIDKVVTLRIDVSKGAITHSIWTNGVWTVLDDWRDDSGDFADGKFGFWPSGRDELGVSNFKFTRTAR